MERRREVVVLARLSVNVNSVTSSRRRGLKLPVEEEERKERGRKGSRREERRPTKTYKTLTM